MRLSIRYLHLVNMTRGADLAILHQGECRYRVGCMKKEILDTLYPEFTDEERRVAGETLDRYLELAWEIFDDLHARDG